MNPSTIYVELIKKPESPKYYRELKKYYLSKGMSNEANAFDNLLKIMFNEYPNLDDHNANPTDEPSSDKSN